MKMNIFYLTFTITVVCDWCNGRTLKDLQLNTLFPAANVLNHLENERIQNSINDFDRQTNFGDFPSSNNDLVIMNSIYEVEDDLEGEFASSEVGQDLRQMWQLFSKRMKRIEKRVNQVQSQTSEMLNRLSMSECSTLPEGSPSGIYTLYMDSPGTRSLQTRCEQEIEGGGWTVILQRVPHENVHLATNFTREMRDYKVGFGNPENDFWIGLENIYLLTRSRDYQLRINLEDFNGETAFAHYDKFYLENERNGYRMQVSGYRGNAGDSLTNQNNPDNFTATGMMFSTHTDDRDTSHEINCSQHWDIGGWWFNRCSWANLMGPYKLPDSGNGIGINWHMWKNKQYIKAATMMIRPNQPYS